AVSGSPMPQELVHVGGAGSQCAGKRRGARIQVLREREASHGVRAVDDGTADAHADAFPRALRSDHHQEVSGAALCGLQDSEGGTFMKTTQVVGAIALGVAVGVAATLLIKGGTTTPTDPCLVPRTHLTHP